MGRGRQKAKQMKVARKLKYFSPDTDLNALQRELADEDSYLAHVPADEPEEDDAIDETLFEIRRLREMPAEEDDIDPEQLMSPSGRWDPPLSNGSATRRTENRSAALAYPIHSS